MSSAPPLRELTVELVPSTCWYTNVRSQVSAADWETCKRFVRDRSGGRCEICGGRGPRWPVECHEIWEYEEIADRERPTKRIQRLTGLIALCPKCHECKHIGRAEAIGRLEAAIIHLTMVNQWSWLYTLAHIEAAREQWARRSKYQWILDISYLTEVLGP